MDEKTFTFEDDEPEENDDEIGFYDDTNGYGGVFPDSDLGCLTSFSYSHIDIGVTDYHFHRPEFDGIDRLAYFGKLKEHSKFNLHHLVYDAHHRDRFKLTHQLSDPEFALVSELFGKEITEQNRPVLGHFRLYHVDLSPQDALIIKNGGQVKSPRIFFLLDKLSICHILFYDPFHEIHPISENELNRILNP